MNLILVSSFDDLNFFKKKNFNNSKIITTYTSVSEYFKQHGYNCIDLNTCIDDNFKIKSFKKYQKKYYSIFKKRDENIFHLFRHELLYNYVGFCLFEYVLKKKISQNSFKKIYICDSLQKKLKYDFLFQLFISILKRKKLSIIFLKEKNKNTNTLKKIKKLIFFNIYFIKKFLKDIRSINTNKKKNNKNLLLLDDLNFKNQLFENFNLKKYNFDYKNNYIKNFKINESLLRKTQNLEKIFQFFFQNYFEKNKYDLNKKLSNFKKFVKENKIESVLWLQPPNTINIKTLIVNYCLKNNIPVYGIQHGGLYGVLKKNNPINVIHQISDYNYCDYFYSYSKFKYKKKIIQKKFFVNKKINFNKESILYIPQITNSLLETKYSYISSNFVKTQKKVIDNLLNSNFNIYLKLYNNFDQDYIERYYPIYLYINAIKNNKRNLRCLYNIDIINAIKKTGSQIIILDYISTPLWEVFNLPIKIFALEDKKYFLFNKKFNEIIKNRVIFYKDANDLQDKIKSKKFIKKKIIFNKNFVL